MTYCCGMRVRDGLVMLADTRTNAGLDNIATYRKLQSFGEPGRSVILVASAGSLSTTQVAIARALDGMETHYPEVRRLTEVRSIRHAAYLLGQAIRRTTDDWREATRDGAAFDACLLVAGAIGGEELRLFLVYGVGNYIECRPETPYLQIGELKFGKPVLDRLLTYETALPETLKLGLLSFCATVRSNLAVALPIDAIVVRQGSTRPELVHRIEPGDPYFIELGDRWGEALRATANDLPPPPYYASPPGGLAVV